MRVSDYPLTREIRIMHRAIPVVFHGKRAEEISASPSLAMVKEQ
jgi:hypothetical protein